MYTLGHTHTHTHTYSHIYTHTCPHLGVTVQQFDGLVGDLQQHLLSPDLIFGVEQNQLLDGVIHGCYGVGLVHHEGGQVLETEEEEEEEEEEKERGGEGLLVLTAWLGLLQPLGLC